MCKVLHEEVIDCQMATVLKKDAILELDIAEDDRYSIQKTLTSEIAFYEEVLAKFGMKYGALPEFEAKLANAELPEHPHWEESIEYRTAYDELENLKKKK